MGAMSPVLRKLVELIRKDSAGSLPKFLGLLSPEPVTTAPASKSEVVKGWQCPKCGNVYGPHLDVCANCNAKPKDAK